MTCTPVQLLCTLSFSNNPLTDQNFVFQHKRLVHVVAPRNNRDADHAVHVKPCWRGAWTFNLEDNF
jgi:hypothetical protein